MSVKDVHKYYEDVCAQYKELLSELKDMEEMVSKDLATPELYEQLKQTAQPILSNYQTISWIIFLLNKPNKKSKKKKYEKQFSRFIDALDKNKSPESIRIENNDVINSLKERRL